MVPDIWGLVLRDLGEIDRLIQFLKQEAEDIGLQGKDTAEYVTRQQNLDREERAAFGVAQNFHAEENR